ncbi:hypothetical protein FDUTEX481_05224 [Tolypothrix sp. PCC 7601]|nr:hypothetical protein FDUTEX481_05224 [Tolypothrix sp. PCC 7601]
MSNPGSSGRACSFDPRTTIPRGIAVISKTAKCCSNVRFSSKMEQQYW